MRELEYPFDADWILKKKKSIKKELRIWRITKENLLWYRNSGENFNEALPIGNGSFGAMVYGGTAKETVPTIRSGMAERENEIIRMHLPIWMKSAGCF